MLTGGAVPRCGRARSKPSSSLGSSWCVRVLSALRTPSVRSRGPAPRGRAPLVARALRNARRRSALSRGARPPRVGSTNEPVAAGERHVAGTRVYDCHPMHSTVKAGDVPTSSISSAQERLSRRCRIALGTFVSVILSTGCAARVATTGDDEPPAPGPPAELPRRDVPTRHVATERTPRVPDELVAALSHSWTDPSTTCEENPHSISFSDDRLQLTLSYARVTPHLLEPDPVAVYEVESANAVSAHVRLRGENRLDEVGAPVTWDIIVLSPDAYCWRRSDWPPHACTPARARCGSDGLP